MTSSHPILPPVAVLVLGGGFAGLRAAWAAREADPLAVVRVAAATPGPGGSSFANPNDAIGLHAPEDDHEREAFVAEAMGCAGAGFIEPTLTRILAEEALHRRLELEAANLPFDREADGALRRYPSCFSPHSRRATVIRGLGAAHAAMLRKTRRLGVEFMTGAVATALLRDSDGRVCGALLRTAHKETAVQPAGAVVAALGGPASLFRNTQAGGGNPGFGQGLLAEAGARMANTHFLQWMWARVATRAFWPVWKLADDSARAMAPTMDDRETTPPPTLARLATQRQGHCPYGHGLASAAVDDFALAQVDKHGVVTVRERLPGNADNAWTAPFGVTLMAHASNGGAVIDAYGRTTVPGLYAAGECATGMHGANRIGGAMAAACLVFGARAGAAAAAEGALRVRDASTMARRSIATTGEPGATARGGETPFETTASTVAQPAAVEHGALGVQFAQFAQFAQSAQSAQAAHVEERRRVTLWLAQALHRCVRPNHIRATADEIRVLREQRHAASDRQAQLMLQTALLLTTDNHQCERC